VRLLCRCNERRTMPDRHQELQLRSVVRSAVRGLSKLPDTVPRPPSVRDEDLRRAPGALAERHDRRRLVFGQYSRMTTNMGPSGAGSKFDSFASPGESFWM